MDYEGQRKDRSGIAYPLAAYPFATEICLTKGVPIESVSKMLGHTNIQTTQIYARVVDRKLSHDMNVLERKLRTAQNGSSQKAPTNRSPQEQIRYLILYTHCTTGLSSSSGSSSSFFALFVARAFNIAFCLSIIALVWSMNVA